MTDQPIKVLLVEDDDDDFFLAQQLFGDIEGTYYSLERASNGAQAVERMARREHDIYLIDYRLGESTGIEVMQRAEDIGITAPIIVLTGQGEPEIDHAAMRAGASDFLIKGEITARSLERSVRYAIERKRAELEIEKLAAFPRHNPNPVIEFTSSGAMSYNNDSAQAMARSLGETSLRPILPADMAQIVTDCLRSGVTRQMQTTHGTRSFVWSFVPIPESQVVHGYAVEITERLNLEAQLRHSVKMEAVGQLAAGVAHDFNNMLTVIQGHSNLLLEARRDDTELSKSLKQICHIAERAGNLIRQLLMFSRKQVMQPKHLDVNEIIHNITRMLQRVVGEDIQVKVVAEVELPSVYGDTGMLEQVLMNLAVNSRDAMPRGGELTVATGLCSFDETAPLLNPEARAGDFVCVSVTDTGCGMDVITLNRIFEPFFTTKEVGKGTGLGLATVYGIIKQHHGWIEVESQVAVGTTFRIYLPASGRAAQRLANHGLQTQKVRGGSETILVVEDEDALRDLVTEILHTYGYKVIAAETGARALKLWEAHKAEVDLLLTDMVMPEGVSGRELAEKLQQDDPQLKVVYTSGYSPGMAGKDLALLEGFNFLPKPYPPSRLAEVVRDCLNGAFQPVKA
jgi:two-component system, cell cycle sensor histidine kinase and response regulator CckA